MLHAARNFRQRDQHEFPRRHAGMRNLQFGIADNLRAEEHDIQVDRPRLLWPRGRHAATLAAQ
jgi:hypothetical protein